MIGIGVGINRQRFAGGFASSYSSRVLADGGTIESLSCVSGVSTLLQTASLLLIPSGYKAGVAYSALPNNGNGDITWSRNSVANRTQSNGTIGSVAVNVPRLSYMYGSCPALLLEPQRTNLFRYSEDFTQALWSKSATSVTANQAISPDGTNDAILYSGNGTSSIKSMTQNITVTTATTYSITIYAKKDSNNFLQITSASTFFGSSPFANFDLNTGVLGTVGSGATASIQSVGNGWYRCTMIATTVGTGGAIGFYLIDSATAVRAQTNTLSTGIFIYGAQLEAGSYATTYIPTTSASVTRNADSFTQTNVYTNGLISSSGGTWFIELKNNIPIVRDLITAPLFLGDTTTANNNVLGLTFGGSSQRVAIYKRLSGALTVLFTTTTDNVKIAIKWNGTSADLFVNGIKQVSATAFTPTIMEYITGNGIGATLFIQGTALFNEPKSDQFCIDLTT